MPQNNIHELLERIFSAPYPYSDALFQDIQNHVVELIEHLMHMDVAQQLAWENLSDERRAFVCAAIEAKFKDEFGFESNELQFMGDQESVGHAFSEVLMSAIPEGISGLIQLCQSELERVPQEVSERFVDQPDIRFGGPAAVELTTFGLTPTHLVLATDAVALLLERAIDAGFFPAEKRFLLRLSADGLGAVTCEGTENKLTQTELIDEIAAFAEVDGRKSAVLLRWAVETLKWVPYLFSGFYATTVEDGFVLTQLQPSQTPPDLFLRWGLK